MKDWSTKLQHHALNELYENYLFRQNQTLVFYMSSVVLGDFTEFPDSSLNQEIRASYNFDDCATSIATVSDVKALIDSGDFYQQVRSFSIIALLTNFGDFFESLREALNIKGHEVKDPIPIFTTGGIVKVRPATLRIAFYISKKFAISFVLTKSDTLLRINCWINIRHMFMHSRGCFSDTYTADMVNKWKNLTHGEPILFDENEVDAIHWFLNSHLSAFVKNLDKIISADSTATQ